MSISRSSALLAALPLLFGMAACSSDDDPTSPKLDTYAITSSKTALTVTQDDSVSFSTVVRDVTKNADVPPQSTIRISIADPAKVGIAGIEGEPESFQVYGQAPGTTTIHLTYANAELSIPVTVVANPVGSIEIDADMFTFTDSAITIEPTLLDNAGQELPIRARTFTSSDDEIATVSEDGVVTPHAAGTVTITVESEGKTAETTVVIGERDVETVTVTPSLTSVTAGETVQLATTLKASNGLILTDRSIAYSSSNEAVATVDEHGLVTTHAVGQESLVTITVTSEGKSGRAQIVVNPDRTVQ